MELRIDFSRLSQAVRQMGATPCEVVLEKRLLPDISPVSIELERGIHVELDEVEVNPGGLLGYEGHQVVLYIPDQGWNIENVLADPKQGRKVHVANCKTLIGMRAKGRFERYVVRNGLSPEFLVSGRTRDGADLEGQADLRVCMNCLKYLNYKNANNLSWAACRSIVEQFSLDQFFATYSSYFTHMPRRSADDIAADRYSPNWDDVSKKYRESVGWTCKECLVNLSDPQHRRLLHVHHMNGVKGDDAWGNLKALCIDCHSKEEMHQHLFVSHGDRRVIQALRQAQGVYETPPAGSLSESDWEEARRNADPAVHGLLFELEAQGYPVPAIGADVIDPASQRVIYSNAEVVWPELSEIVVLEWDGECKKLEERNWTVFVAQDLLDSLIASKV